MYVVQLLYSPLTFNAEMTETIIKVTMQVDTYVSLLK